ncbi:MAG: DUF309 domain-containing protein [Thermomicrobiales bacterium]|nr:DUF309 domain-containing protein [Thermomicrobiales bacterium]
MPQHPEESDARVIQIGPHLRRRQITASTQTDRLSRSELLFDGASADRLVRIDAAMPPIEGEFDGVDHIASLTLGVSSGAFYPLIATEDTPAAAAVLGFTELEIMLQTPGEYSPSFAQLVAANAHAAGVTIRSVHTIEQLHPVMSPYERRAEEGREMMYRAIEFASIVGAGVLVWHGPYRREVASKVQWQRFIEETRELASQCRANGITLALENVGRCALGHVRDVTAFARELAEFEDDSIGFVFDPFQAAEAGANPFMMLAAMGNRVVNVHVSDWLESDPSQRHLPPGDGDLPWPAITRAIAGSGYEGPLIIEGVLGSDEIAADRVRDVLEPLIRAVFSFPPKASRDKGVLPPPTELPPGVLEGIRLFNQRRFYEQHEVIEQEWHAEHTTVRVLYQGILQIGVGFHHALNGNFRGAVALLTAGADKVAHFTPTAYGIDTNRLVLETRNCITQLNVLGERNLAAFESELIPQIHLTNTK